MIIYNLIHHRNKFKVNLILEEEFFVKYPKIKNIAQNYLSPEIRL